MPTTASNRCLSPELARLNQQIEGYARDYGLDFYETIFEMLDFEEMNMVAAYGGFPNRYPHWKFGMEYERLTKSYSYGLHKIYEMVINNDPCYAYLLECNHLVDQKIVMAHVYGHCDFFKNNIWFSKTNRKMMDVMANHATKIRKYIDRFGIDAVEGFVDVCLSVDDLIDHHSKFIERKAKPAEVSDSTPIVRKITSSEYMDGFINPPEFLEVQKQKLDDARRRKRRFPEDPQKDVLLFLIENAPLEHWQRDIMWMIREEAYYFTPQGQTKIMNEGWATYWHAKIMTERALNDAEVIDFADHHSGTVAMHPGQINPYKLGFELWKDIEDRWNKGKFGKDYDDCDDWTAKRQWDDGLGLGREKIFETRRVHNDITFIDAFFTEEFCYDHKFFSYAYNQERGVYEIVDRDWNSVKQRLLRGLTNFGRPFIYVADGNFENRGELLLDHRHEGIDLRVDYAKDTLKNLYQVWGRPVHLRTTLEGKEKLFSFDGEKHFEKEKLMVSTNDIDGVKVTVDLEASDTLAVLLKSMRVEGAKQGAQTVLREQARAIVDEVTYLDGELALIEVDGMANAVQIRSRKPTPQEDGVRFVEVVLRNGNLITVEAKGSPVHLSQENLGKLTETLTRLVRD